MGKTSTNGGYTLSNNVTCLCHNLYLYLYPFLMLELHGAKTWRPGLPASR